MALAVSSPGCQMAATPVLGPRALKPRGRLCLNSLAWPELRVCMFGGAGGGGENSLPFGAW